MLSGLIALLVILEKTHNIYFDATGVKSNLFVALVSFKSFFRRKNVSCRNEWERTRKTVSNIFEQKYDWFKLKHNRSSGEDSMYIQIVSYFHDVLITEVAKKTQMIWMFDWGRRKRRRKNNTNKQQAWNSILFLNLVNLSKKSMMVQLNDLAYFSETHLRQKLMSKFSFFVLIR